MASQFEELITKQLQLLKETVPKVSRVALLHHAEIAPTVLSEADTAARRLGLTARAVKATGKVEFESAFTTIRGERADAIHVLPSPFFSAQRKRLIELAATYRLSAVYEFKNYVEDGGLMSYGPSINEMFGRMASYVDRILKGAKPGDLPIERPTRFELVINMKTAKALGLVQIAWAAYGEPGSCLAIEAHVVYPAGFAIRPWPPGSTESRPRERSRMESRSAG